jgi:hypothetical protein
VEQHSRAYTLGEEFTDYVLVDEKRESVVLNIDKEHFKVLFREYKKMGFTLKHVSSFEEDKCVTCVFVKESQDK